MLLSPLPPQRHRAGSKQGEHPEDDKSTGRRSEHAGSDQQAVRDPQLPTPGISRAFLTEGAQQNPCSTCFSLKVLFCWFLLQSLDEVIKDLTASVHRELTEKQSLAFSMTFLPTKLEFTTASAESSFVFEFSSPDARSNFEQTFEDAKKKLGEGNRAAVEIKYILKKVFKSLPFF